MAWGTASGEHFLASNPASALAASTALPTAGTTLTGGSLLGSIWDTGGETNNLMSFVPDATGAGDCSPGTQTWLNKGGVLSAPAGTFKLLTKVNVGSHLRIRGGLGGRLDSGGAIGGTCFVGGASSFTMFDYTNAEYVDTSGVSWDTGANTGITCVLLDSNNAPASHHLWFDKFSIYGRALGGSNIGFQIGQSAVNNYQIDTWRIGNGVIDTIDTGIRVQSGNAGNLSLIEQVLFHVYTTGIQLTAYGNLKISNSHGGVSNASAGTFILVDGPGNILKLESLWAEAAYPTNSTAFFLKVLSAGNSTDLLHPIQFDSCQILQQIDIQIGRVITSHGCLFAAPFTLSGNDVQWLSDGTDVLNASASVVATGSRSYFAQPQADAGYNRLTANQANFTGAATTGWAVSGNCTIAYSAAAVDSVPSILLTSVASGAMSATTPSGTGGFVVKPNQVYSFSALFLAAVSARACQIQAGWYTAAGALSRLDNSNTANDNTTTRTAVTMTTQSPSDAAFLRLIVQVNATGAASEQHYVSNIMARQGVSQVWVPGTGLVPFA